MINILNNPATYADIFLLIFVRFLTFFNIVPIFSSRNIPQMTKVGYAFFLSLIVFQFNLPTATVTSELIIPFGVLILKEFFVGWVLGMVVYFVYSAVMLAGQMIDTQVGFSMVNVMDPMSQISLPITGNIYSILLTMLLLASRTHYIFLKGLIRSFELVPPGSVTISPILEHSIIDYFGESLLMSVQISMPIVGGMFIINLVLAVMARTVPQINMFVAGVPLKLLIGLVMILISIAYFGEIYQLLVDKMIDYMDLALRGLML